MQTHLIGPDDTLPDFDTALRRATALADELLGKNMLLPGMTASATWSRRRMPANATRDAQPGDSGITR